jgi:hypothetical protein
MVILECRSHFVYKIVACGPLNLLIREEEVTSHPPRLKNPGHLCLNPRVPP